MENDNQNLSVENEAQADELLESIERPEHAPIQDTPEQVAPQTVDEWELTVGGKAIKAKRDQIMQWAQQGYSAPGRISQLTKELESWKQKESQFNEMHSKYGPVDEYVRQNPQFWDHVLQSYEQRNQALSDQGNPLAATVTSLQAQVQELIQYKNQIEETRQKEIVAQEDQAYTQTLEEMKKSYPDVDFDSPDESGKSLEYRVLEHAQKEGIKNFKTAFRDYYHDELVKRSESKAKESLLKDKQKNTKLGILGITQTPSRKPQGNIRSQSYDDLAAEALADLGINR